MDLGSVNAPPLEHRQSGVGWSGDTAILLQRVMPLAKILGPALTGPQERIKIYEKKTWISISKSIGAALALARGQRLQATSRKLQAPSRKLDKTKLQCYCIL